MKIIQRIYIVLFVVLCCLPLSLWTFFKNDVPIGKTALTEFPEWFDENGIPDKNFSDKFDMYFTEHLIFRPQLVSCDNYLKSQLLKSNTANVISGKNGYLFSIDTLDDYTGKTFSERKCHNIVQTVKLIQEKAEHTGNRFVFTVAPNKNTIYSQYMPDRYKKGKTSNLDLLETLFEKYGVCYCNLKSVLQSVDNELYLKRDTHWNNLGAVYGVNALVESVGKEHKNYNGQSYIYEKKWRGDLDKMLYPYGGMYDNQYYFSHNYNDLVFLMPMLGNDKYAVMEELMSDAEKNDAMIKTLNNKANGNLLMIRDSFGRAMLPYLTENYRCTEITRSQPFSLLTLTENTDVIYEIVERNLGNIVKSAPIMSAEECEMPTITKTISDNTNRFYANTTDSYIKICGTLSEKYFDTDSEIKICLTAENFSKTFNAFPICEYELMNIENSDYGYSLMIANDIPEGTYSISAFVSKSNGEYISTGTLGKWTK